MKFENLLTTIVASLLIVSAFSVIAAATPVSEVTDGQILCGKYTIDGSLADWGIDLNDDWSQNATWLPNSGVTFVVEDNRDPVWGELPYGVHIRGTGSSYTKYNEPKIQHKNGNWYTEPYAGEAYDLEALYLDEDENCVYVALVTSEAATSGGDKRPGDLALNLDKDKNTGVYGYEYGVKFGDNYLNQFDVYSMPAWEPSNYFPTVKPTYFKTATSNLGSAMGAYVDTGISDNGKTNYVVEVAIPKSLIGDPEDVAMGNLYIGDACGNDYIPAPEFVFAAIPVAIVGTVLVFAYRSAKRKA